MGNVAQVILILAALLEASTQAAIAAQRVGEMLARAHNEGRDLTDDEVREAGKLRKQVVGEWQDAFKDKFK